MVYLVLMRAMEDIYVDKLGKMARMVVWCVHVALPGMCIASSGDISKRWFCRLQLLHW